MENNKAIDIIISKCVNFIYFHNNQTLEYYNKHVADWRQLTQEEFDLLKTHYELYKNKMNEKKKENL